VHQSPSRLDTPLSPWTIFPLACALVVIGAKCWMINRYGNPTPYWDQWDAEGASLYPRYFAGALSFSDLVAPHNEHRILVTRLWLLLLLELEGYWDPILQMLANTLLLGGIIALLVAAFRPLLDRAAIIAFAVFATVLFALPLDWGNTLSGFNSQWYFMQAFSIAGLLAIIAAGAFALRWWIALALLVLSYFSMAGGAATAAAAFAICALQLAVGRRSGARELLALAILAALTLAMAYYVPTAEGPDAPAKTQSIGDFMRGWLEVAGWPLTYGQSTPVLLLCAIPIQAPAFFGCLHLIGLRPPLDDRRWLLAALIGWVMLQAAGLAYSRGGATESRYLDMLMVGLLVSYAWQLWAWRASQDSLRRWFVFGLSALWLLLIFVGVAMKIVKDSAPQMAKSHALGLVQTENVRTYLAAGDIGALENKPILHIPYPNAHRLARIVSSPAIRAILPPVLVGEAAVARAQQRGLARFTGGLVEAIKAFMLHWGVALMPAGLMLFLLGVVGGRRRRESETTQ